MRLPSALVLPCLVALSATALAAAAADGLTPSTGASPIGPRAGSGPASQDNVDLRVGLGMAASHLGYGRLSVVGSNPGVLGGDDGLVFGLGLQSTRLQEFHGEDASVGLFGGLLQFGLCHRVGWASQVELTVLGHYGFAGAGDAVPLGSSDGKYWAVGGEFGWFWTAQGGYQLGFTGGYTLWNVTASPQGGEVTSRETGFDAGLSLGYRF